ncbi:hemolysin family protein [Microbacterium sp. YY-01]|uniref:hemolysin family protein n=1 Tax=Microbacterium sp. YY-01 TaxID=3421634 RepID=UPI003D16C61B
MSPWMGLVWLVILLVINAFFVAAEFAVISARRSQIEPRAEEGSRAARTALYAMEHATLMLATSQLGITVCSLVILNVSEPAIHHLMQTPLQAWGAPDAVVASVSFAVALIVVSALHVIFGEMVPKNMAFSVPDRAVLVLATPLVWLSKLLHPVIWLLNTMANGVLLLFRVQPRNEAASAFTIGEVATIVDQSRREGVLTDTAGTVAAAVEFTDKKARDIAVSLSELVTVAENVTAEDIERAVSRHGFSRYVVVDGEGVPVGYVHLKDVLRDVEDPLSEPVPLPSKRIHHLIPVQEDTDLEDALAIMRRAGRHLARVRNAQGETTAVLFLEDIIEELIGEVQDATARRFGR